MVVKKREFTIFSFTEIRRHLFYFHPSLSAILILPALFTLTLNILFVPPSSAAVKGGAKGDDCKKILSFGGKTKSRDEDINAFLSEKLITELLSPDPKKNLVAQHPFVAMSATQRMYAMVLAAGSEVRNPFLKGRVPIYNLFSTPSEINGYLAINGHENALNSKKDGGLNAFVQGLRKATGAKQDKVPTFEGPPGSGKTLIQTIFRNALNYFSRNDKRFYYWVYEVVNLEEIAKVYPEIRALPGKKFLPPTQGRSILALLPKSYQDGVLKLDFVQKAVKSMGAGAPNPDLRLDSHTKLVRNLIVEYYSKRRTGDEADTPLTDEEIVGYLSNHIRLRRVILGEGNMTPVIDSQGKNPNMAAIMGGRNPIFASLFGMGHPFATNVGVLGGADGSSVMFDEVPRNTKEFKNQLLRFFQDGTLEVNGQIYPLDSFIMAAANTENMDEMRTDSSLTQRAFLDRLQFIRLPWSFIPHEVAKTTLMMSGGVVVSKLPLSGKNGGDVLTRTSLNELFPLLEEGKEFLGTDGRYKIVYKEAGSEVFLNPHTLMLIATVAAATRISSDPKAAAQVKPMGGQKDIHPIALMDEFKNPITRLRFLMGEFEMEEEGKRDLLFEISELLKEGEFGISARDANDWLQAVKRAALLPGNGNSMTPRLALEVFNNALNDGNIKHDSPQQREEWKGLAKQVMAQIILPKLRADVLLSLHGSKDVERIYQEVISELSALSFNSAADKYHNPRSNKSDTIDRKRLDEVEKIYEKITGRPLSPARMGMFFFNRKGKGQSSEDVREKGLERAIVEYLARIESSLISYSALEEASLGGTMESEVAAKYRTLWDNLVNRKGYDSNGVKDAIALVKESDAKDMGGIGMIK